MYGDSDQPVRVAAGVFMRDGSVLLCQRGINRRYGLKWEFPGGKTYPGESVSECLVREIEEELGVTISSWSELKTLEHEYSDGGHFLVTFYLITEWEGEFVNRVFERVEWVAVGDLPQRDLLDGTRPILQYLHP